MKIECSFKSLDHSNALVSYVEERFAKLEKFEMKPVLVKVTISVESKHRKKVEAFCRGVNGTSFTAKAVGSNFHMAVDKSLTKLLKQMEKNKGKVKHHKNFKKSASARLDRQILEEYKEAS